MPTTPTVNQLKIRLGAAVSQIINFGAAPFDLGSTAGGVELTYNPTILAIEIDQALMPIQVYKTKEELEYACALSEYSMRNVALVWSYAQGAVTTVTGTPNTDTLYFGNYGNVPQAVFDAAINKQDGTTNQLLLHLNKVYSAKSAKIGFYKEKATSFDKLSLGALADMTQPAGQQGGWLRESY